MLAEHHSPRQEKGTCFRNSSNIIPIFTAEVAASTRSIPGVDASPPKLLELFISTLIPENDACVSLADLGLFVAAPPQTLMWQAELRGRHSPRTY